MTHPDQTDRRPRRLSVLPLIIFALLASLSAGCGKDSDPPMTSPNLSSSGASALDLFAAQSRVAPNQGLVDLTTGSRGTLEFESRTRLVYDDPSRPPDEDLHATTNEWVIVGPQTRLRTEYVHVQVSFEIEGKPETGDYLYRQDRSGYYQVFPVLTQEGSRVSPLPELAASANGGFSLAGPPGEALTDETTLLAYPLHPNASWPEQSGHRLRYRVVGREDLSVPAGVFSAWKIEDLAGDPATEYRRTLWYSTPGLIAEEGSVQFPVRDVNGERIGTRYETWSGRLTSWTPGEPGVP